MGLEKLSLNISKKCLNYAKALGKKSILETTSVPCNFDTAGLRFLSNLNEDVACFTKKTSALSMTPPSVAKSDMQSKIEFILLKYNPEKEGKIVKGLLNPETLSYIEKFVSDETYPKDLLRFLDVIKRRKYDFNSLKKMIGEKRVIDDKLINTLEFKNFDKFKDITLDNFTTLSLDERKEYINAFVSVHYQEGHLKELPDIAIYNEIRNLKKPSIPSAAATKAEKDNYLKMLSNYRTKIDDFYSETLNKMLETIPRTKADIPASTQGINPNDVLIKKPALTTSVSNIKTKEIDISGHKVKVGLVDENGTYFVHNLEDRNIPRLEGYLLTDPDATLCTGFLGGKGELKATTKPGVVVSPKNSMDDLLISFGGDAGSTFGAQNNYFNLKSMFLKEDNEFQSYIPKLVKEKLNLSSKEYDLRMSKVKDITHLEEIKIVDNELYDAIKTVISENYIMESIMRPNIEAIYLPKGMKISDNVAGFAQRYDIPILFNKS